MTTGGFDLCKYPDQSLLVADPRQGVLDPANPYEIGKAFIREVHTHRGYSILRYLQGDFYSWKGPRWVVISGDRIDAQLWGWAASKVTPENLPFKPTLRRMTDVVAALKALAFLEIQVEPCWIPLQLNGGNDLRPPGCTKGLIVFRNGILQTESKKLVPHDPAYFNTSYIDFDYQPRAESPSHWLRFLESVWRNDPESVSTLQEIIGYLLTTDTSLQKIFLLIGPPRSGKGVITNVIRNLVGKENMANPTLSALGQQFGLASMIRRQVAVITDARLNGRVDLSAVTETLLRISGEDPFSVPVKYKADWIGKIGARVVICSNELPTFNDASGAIASRFVVLKMKNSFLGQEDTGLHSRLERELPAILNWALEGLDRLMARGKFIQPPSALDEVEELGALGSPVMSFVKDCCFPADDIGRDDLFSAWRNWCFDEGRHPGNKETFGRNLRAAMPSITPVRLRAGAARPWGYRGIRLRKPDDNVSLGPLGLPGLPGHQKENLKQSASLPMKEKTLFCGPGGPGRPTHHIEPFDFEKAPA